MKKSERLRKSIAILIVVFLLLIVFLPISSDKVSATTGSVLDLALLVSSVGTGVAIGAAVADGPGAFVGGLIGLGLGLFFTWEGENPAGEVYSPKNYYAVEKAMDLYSMLNLSDAQAVNLMESFEALTFFYARKAEFAAKALYDNQTDNNHPHLFDPDWIFQQAQIYNGTMSQLWAMTETYNQILSVYDDLPSMFQGTYAGMAWGVDSGATAGPFISAGTEPLFFRFVYDIATSGTSTVVLNPAIPLTVIKTPNTGPDSCDLVISDIHGNEVFNETYDQPSDKSVWVIDLDILDIPIGRYHFNLTSGYKVRGFAAPSPSDTGVIKAVLTGYRRVSYANNSLCWERNWYYSGGGWRLDWYGEVASVVNAPIFVFQGVGTWEQNKVIANHTVPITGNPSIGGFFAWAGQGLLDYSVMYSTILAFAQTSYNLVKSVGGAYNPPPADIIFADPNQMEGLNWQQIYLMYMAYLYSASEWFFNYSIMDTTTVNFSAESLNLTMRAELRDSGNKTICGNSTVMTPFISIYNMTLTTGNWSYFDQPGFVMAWGNTTEMADHATTGKHASLTTDFNISTCRYIQVSSGWSIRPMEMLVDGEYNTTVTLHVTTLNYVIGNVSGGGDNPPPQSMGDLQWFLEHWYYIGFLVAAIIVVIAAAVGKWILLLLGILILAVSAVGYLAVNLGDVFSWWNPYFQIEGSVQSFWWFE